MKFTILIPHYKTPKITAVSIYNLIKNKGNHEIDIVVIDNNEGDKSIYSLNPFLEHITIVNYPKNILQSHGISFDYVLPHIDCEWFITMESDSFPKSNTWLDYYEFLINAGYDGAGSLLKLSGGHYVHPCGALYRKSLWKQAKDYCNKIQYLYFPNAAMKEDFQCHLMVHNSILKEFLNEPQKVVELSSSYLPFSHELATKKLQYYLPVVGPFHNGMGNNDESIKTYGERNIPEGKKDVLLDNEKKIIRRIGYEPGQWFSYFLEAMGRKIYHVPTTVKWLPNRINQQQEYTYMENGFIHLWGVSAYYKANIKGYEDVIEFKENQVNELYDALPNEYKNPA